MVDIQAAVDTCVREFLFKRFYNKMKKKLQRYNTLTPNEF